MKIETYEQRVLVPDKNKWLYNEKENIVSDKVYLGKNADANAWVEITQEEYEEIINKESEE